MHACDYVMPDLMRIGGVSGWLRAAPIAAAAGIEVSTHLYPEVAAHVNVGCARARILEQCGGERQASIGFFQLVEFLEDLLKLLRAERS